MKMMKKFKNRGLQSNKYGAQLNVQLAARREFMIWTLQCIITKKKIIPQATREWLGKKQHSPQQ